MSAKKFYLAGKIEKNDWRHEIVPGLREHSCGDETMLNMKTCNGHPYVGPYFIGCDHGCFHNPTGHGLLNEFACIDLSVNDYVKKVNLGDGHYEPGVKRRDVKELCLEWIRRCDVLFAWIDSIDCYGTLAEIGFAHACEKEIWIAYSPNVLKELKINSKVEWIWDNITSELKPKIWDQVSPTHEMWFIDQMADKVGESPKPKVQFETWCNEEQ